MSSWSSISVRAIAARGLLILDATTRVAFSEPTPTAKYCGLTKLLLRDVAATTSPPRGWIAASTAGILVAVWLQVHSRRRWRRLQDRIARARDGVLDRERRGLMSLDAQALALLLLTAAPLAAAAQYWLVP